MQLYYASFNLTTHALRLLIRLPISILPIVLIFEVAPLAPPVVLVGEEVVGDHELVVARDALLEALLQELFRVRYA